MMAAFNASDLEGVAQAVGDGMVYTVHGRNVIAGTYEGLSAYIELLGLARQLTYDTASVTPRVVLADDDHVMMRARFAARRQGRTADLDMIYMYRFVGGRLVEGHTVPIDHAIADEFWGGPT
jgi:ketosteroid isomerase-like protein